MGIGAAIAGGVSAVAGIAGSAMSSSAASSAADTQAAAANRAADLQHQQYLQTRGDLAPYRDTGAAAFNRLGQIFGLNGPAPAAAPSGGGGGGLVPAPQGLNFGQGLQLPTQGQLFALNGPNGAQYQIGAYNASSNSDPGFDPNHQIYYVLDQNGNSISQFDPQTPDPAQGSSVSQWLANLNVSPGGTPQSGGTAASGGGPSVDVSGAAGNPLAAYGLPGLTYNPADYGLGNGVFDPSSFGLGNGTFQPTQAQLESMPGYQFTRDQGLKSVQNSATARGQGVSGAALKGAADYATGLANNTVQTEAGIYNNNLANAENIYGGNVQRTQGVFQQNLSNVINPLFQYAGLGENAAAQTGTIGSSIINSQSNLLTGAANAQAAGTIGSANAISGGLNAAGSAPMNYMLYNQLYGSGGGGGGYVDNTSTF